MKLNVAKKSDPVFTHEGARAIKVDAESQLRRSVMACLLWEDSFYESGEDSAKRICYLAAQCRPEFVAACAYHARTAMKLRHAPLLLVREMARLPKHKALVKDILRDVIQRPDEITEFLAIYWKDDKDQPLSAQVKKGLAAAFQKFDEYAFAKYDRDGQVKLRDALFLSHAKPAEGQAGTKARQVTTSNSSNKPVWRHENSLFEKIVSRTLETPDTWEVKLSGGADKRETFIRLMEEKKLGALAFLRNLRNMKESGVPVELVGDYASSVNVERVLPFRFIAAARAVPGWELVIEPLMLKCLDVQEKLRGKTAVVVDNSGSMHGAKVSRKSDMDRSDAACALAVLLREICEDVVVIGFGSNAKVIPARHGFALVEAIKAGPGGGTDTLSALKLAASEGYDRIVVITDEQSHTEVDAPKVTGRGYFINVATYQNGIGYGPWVHIDGWSESVVEFIREWEKGEG